MTDYRINIVAAHLCFALVAGCSNSTSGLMVSGRVTYQGEKVVKGKILLLPTDQGKPQFTTKIADGKYAFESVGPGSYKVQVFGYKGTGEFVKLGGIHGDEQRESEIQFLPSDFNKDTVLTLDVTAESSAYDLAL